MLLDPSFIKMFTLEFLDSKALLESSVRESGIADIEDLQASQDPN
jgi:hypothetical protein